MLQYSMLIRYKIGFCVVISVVVVLASDVDVHADCDFLLKDDRGELISDDFEPAGRCVIPGERSAMHYTADNGVLTVPGLPAPKKGAYALCTEFNASKHRHRSGTWKCDLGASEKKRRKTITLDRDFSCRLILLNANKQRLRFPGLIEILYEGKKIGSRKIKKNAFGEIEVSSHKVYGIIKEKKIDRDAGKIPVSYAYYTERKNYYTIADGGAKGFLAKSGKFDLLECSRKDLIKRKLSLKGAVFEFVDKYTKTPLDGSLEFSKKHRTRISRLFTVQGVRGRYYITEAQLGRLGERFFVVYKSKNKGNKEFYWKRTIRTRDIVKEDGVFRVELRPTTECRESRIKFDLSTCKGFFRLKAEGVVFDETIYTATWFQNECDSKQTDWRNDEGYYIEFERVGETVGACRMHQIEGDLSALDYWKNEQVYPLVFRDESQKVVELEESEIKPKSRKERVIKRGKKLFLKTKKIFVKGKRVPLSIDSIKYDTDKDCSLVSRRQDTYISCVLVEKEIIINVENRYPSLVHWGDVEWKLHIPYGIFLEEERGSNRNRGRGRTAEQQFIIDKPADLQRLRELFLAKNSIEATLSLPGYVVVTPRVILDRMKIRKGAIAVTAVRDPLYRSLYVYRILQGLGSCSYERVPEFAEALENIRSLYTSATLMLGRTKRQNSLLVKQIEQVETLGHIFGKKDQETKEFIVDEGCQIQAYVIAGAAHLTLGIVADKTSQHVYEHAYEYLDAAQRMSDVLKKRVSREIRLELGLNLIHSILCFDKKRESEIQLVKILNRRMKSLIQGISEQKTQSDSPNLFGNVQLDAIRFELSQIMIGYKDINVRSSICRE